MVIEELLLVRLYLPFNSAFISNKYLKFLGWHLALIKSTVNFSSASMLPVFQLAADSIWIIFICQLAKLGHWCLLWKFLYSSPEKAKSHPFIRNGSVSVGWTYTAWQLKLENEVLLKEFYILCYIQICPKYQKKKHLMGY